MSCCKFFIYTKPSKFEIYKMTVDMLSDSCVLVINHVCCMLCLVDPDLEINCILFYLFVWGTM